MTRITNFGRKRTYVQAGFSSVDNEATVVQEALKSSVLASTNDDPAETSESAPGPPPKKKRKRTPKSKRDGHGALPKPEGASATTNPGQAGSAVLSGEEQPSTKSKKKLKKEKFLARQKAKKTTNSETRRVKRISDRNASTTCFACREKGHAAKDCPRISADASPSKDGMKKNNNAANVVGICYRCGSTKHTLSRCRKPIDPLDPLPFASCFVCSGTGHLASACPQNKEKGVYPNGGCCKLCGGKSHLAKDCGLNKDDIRQGVLVLGSAGAGEGGADEDDFHVLKRRKVEVDREDGTEKKLQKRMANGAAFTELTGEEHSESPPKNGSDPVKKVVFF